MYKKLVLPSSLLMATIIGAGIFALPYVFQKAGIITGLFYLIVFGACFTMIHLMYGDVILKTKENYRFAGYARHYLGKWGFWSAILASIIGMIFVLTVYLVLSTSFIKLIYPIGSDLYKLILFWILGSIAVFWNIEKVSFSEFLISLGIGLIVLIIFILGLSGFKQIANAPLFNINYLFLPYGAILFSLAGRPAIPSVIRYFQKNNEPANQAKKSIILGTLAPVFIYALFALGILGLSKTVSQDSVSGLIGAVPGFLLVLLGILGIISLWSSYIVIARDVKKSLEHDFGFPLILSGVSVVILPIFLYFIGFQNFLGLVGIIGGVFTGLEGILITLIWQKAKKSETGEKLLRLRSPLPAYLLFLIFLGGIIYSLLY